MSGCLSFSKRSGAWSPVIQIADFTPPAIFCIRLGQAKAGYRARPSREFRRNPEGLFQNLYLLTSPSMVKCHVCEKTCFIEYWWLSRWCDIGEDLLTWAKIATKNKIAYSSICCSIYYEMSPSRIPDNDDVVGRCLDELQNIVDDDQKLSLRRYCALWHKMRASSYLRLVCVQKHLMKSISL